MTAELIIHEPKTLQLWSDEAAAAAIIAADLAPTPFVPGSLRVITHGQPDIPATTANIAAALLTGQELGLAPMASLRAIDVIQGTPALRAVALRALMQAAGHDMWLVESTKTRCVMRGKRAGSSNEQEVTWTIDRAKDLGLAGKENWRKQPTAMLIARASAELARLIAADAILGLPYIAEELEDDDNGYEAAAMPTAPPPRRTAQRRVRTVKAVPTFGVDEPPLDEVGAVPHQETPPPGAVDAALPDEPPLDEPTPDDAITPAQLKMLHATLNEIVTTRAEGLALISGLLERDITSTKELTKTESLTVLDELVRRRTEQEADDADPDDIR